MSAAINPAVALMNRLTYPRKFGLISVLFLVPLVLVMAYLMQALNDQIEFTRKESLGTRYLRPLIRLYALAGESRRLARDFHQGKRDKRPDLLRTQQAEMETRFKELEAVQRELGAELESTERFVVVRKSWDFLKSNSEIFPAKDTDSLHESLLEDMRKLFSQVGDKSNLILDPDLDSYYLMDALLLKLPEAVKKLMSTHFLAEGIVARGTLTEAEKGELIGQFSLIRENLDEMLRGLQVGYENNKPGHLRARLDKQVKDYQRNVTAYLDAYQRDILEAATPTMKAAALVKSPVSEAVDLWDRVTAEEDELFVARMNLYRGRRTLVWISTLIVLGVVAYLWVGFYAAVMRTVSRLEHASSRMLGTELGGTVELETRDEMGRVAESFNAIAGRLRREWEQAHEESRKAREAEAALREAERKYRGIVENASEGIFQSTPDGRYLSANPALARIYGYAKAEEILTGLTDIGSQLYFDPERRAEFATLMERHGEVHGFESRVRRKDGVVIWIQENARAVRDPQGNILHYEGSVVDITARRTAEEALTRSEEQYRDLFENANDLIQSVDPEGRLSYVNRAWREALGYGEGEIAGLRWLDVVSPECRAEAKEAVDRVLARGTSERLELAFQAKDGRGIRAEGSLSCRRVDGKAVSTRAIFRDVTDRKRAEQEILKAKELAEGANRAKSQFLANMSHELRTPLNSVIGFSNILLKNKTKRLEPQELSYLQRILDNGKHLLGLINSILDLSKVEAGKMELNLGTASLDRLIRDTVAQLEGRLVDRDVRLLADLPPSAAAIETDVDKLKQVLINLVGNAVKFTEKGDVTVRLVTDPATGRPTRIDVVDMGPGIPRDQIERIFEAFQQGDSGTARRYGGTGLGLTISRALCDLLGYRIEVASEVGRGSTFSVVLDGAGAPRAPRPALAPLLASPEGGDGDLRGRSVLVIDDEEDSRVLLAQHLADCGCRVVTAASGSEGVRLAKESRPDLITLDLMMPSMNGWAVLKELKRDAALKDIPVVVVSIVAKENRGTIFGAADILSKPVQREALCEVVRRNLPAERGRILIVEDDPDGRKIIAEYLADLASEIRAAENGQEALTALERFEPDLIILDLMMPVMDGFTFLDRLRQLPRARGIPVVVATAKELTVRELNQLNEAVSVIVRKGGDLRLDMERAARAILAARQPAQVAAPPPGEKVLVPVRRVVAALIPGYLKNRQDDVRAMREALDRGDFEAIRVLGHNLKGIGGSYGFAPITDIGKAIEDAAKTKAADEILRRIAALSDYLGRVEVIPDDKA